MRMDSRYAATPADAIENLLDVPGPGKQRDKDPIAVVARSSYLGDEHVCERATPYSTEMYRLTGIAPIVALVACGSSPTAPDSTADRTLPASHAPALRIVADGVIDITSGESRALEIEERDATGPIRRSASMYSWSSSNTNVVAMDEGGVMRAGPGLGEAIVTARSSTGVQASARIWVQLPEGTPSGFRITLAYGEGVPDEWRPRFRSAADRWERVIRASLLPIDVGAALRGQDAWCFGLPEEMFSGIETGTRVWIGRHTGVGTGGGVCLARSMPSSTAAVGWIKVGGLNEPPFVPSAFLTLHEMGHALGLVGIPPAEQPAWLDRSAQIYRGPLALEGHRRQFGKTIDSLSLSSGHWQFFEDVMSTQRQVTTITQVSVGALMDLGYPAAWYGADGR